VDQCFLESKAIADNVEGMLSPFSMAVMDSLLSFQATRGVKGDIVELGVYRGKSATILSGRLSVGEQLHLYDIADYFDRDALKKTGAPISFNIANTTDLSRRSFRSFKGKIRFCHIDASHMFEPTMHEMALADYMLAADGILCLDDYTNLNYSQILAATFKYLFTRRTDLTMFMVTDEKAYLCRRSRFPAHAEFVLKSIISKMAERGVPEACIARTDDTPTYGAFYLRRKNGGEVDDFYGVNIYRQFYEVKNHSLVLGTAKSMLRRIKRKISRV
jgi:Methyltransferase domain